MKTTLFTLLSFVTLAIQISTTGAAPHRCTYVFYYQPVCGNDGKTYINSGHLTCEKLKHEGLKKQFDGKCPFDSLETVPGNVEKEFGIDGQPLIGPHNAEQLNTPVSTLHNPETHQGAFDNYDPNRPGHMQGNYPGSHQGNYPGNYPGNGNMRGWGDNSREYPDNSFEIKIGGGHGGMGSMGKGLIAGAVLGKVASDYSKKHDKSKIQPGGGYPVNTGYQQPSPVNTGYQQPKPMQPSPVNTGYQQPKPYPVQPSPVNTGYQQPKPYPVQPSPVNTGYQQPKPYPVQPSPVNTGYQQPKPVQPSPVNPASRPSPYNPYAPSAPAQPSKTNTNTGRGNSGGGSKGRKSGGGRRKGRSVMESGK